MTVERFRFDFMRFDSIRFESTPYIRVWRAIELYKPCHLLPRSPPTRSFATSTCTSSVRLAAAACTRSAMRITAVRDPWRTCTALSGPSKPVCCEPEARDACRRHEEGGESDDAHDDKFRRCVTLTKCARRCAVWRCETAARTRGRCVCGVCACVVVHTRSHAHMHTRPMHSEAPNK